MKKKKILLSAYSCEPNTGSEHEVGWQWIKNLSKNTNNIEVITRISNKNKILKEIKKEKVNVKFHFYDLPQFLRKIIKRKNRPNSYLYFILWQLGIFLKFKKYIKSNYFDYVHHVTFVSLRFPSFLGLTNKNFIFGPVSGGEYVPIRYRKYFTIKEHIIEIIRDLSNFYIKFSPLLNLTFLTSKKIIVNSELTKKLIPAIYHKKIKIIPSISISDDEQNYKYKYKKINSPFRICFVGRPYGWKGIYLAIESIKNLSKFNKNFKFVIVCNKNENSNFEKLIKKKKITDITEIKNNMSRSKLLNFFKTSDLNLFPSFRDSGGFVVLESQISNTPSLVLDISGTADYINKNGIKIKTTNKSFSELSNQISLKINEFIFKTNLRKSMYKNFKPSFKKFSWENKIKKIY